MTETHETNSNKTKNQRPKMWVFALIFTLFAGVMYGSTWYRIRTAGFLGTGANTVAHPDQVNPNANQPTNAVQPNTPSPK